MKDGDILSKSKLSRKSVITRNPFSSGLRPASFCSLLAVGTAVGLYFLFSPMQGIEGTGWICILGAAPFAACGFFRYHGMTAEQFAWAWFQSEFLMPKKLVFQSDCFYYGMIESARKKRWK